MAGSQQAPTPTQEVDHAELSRPLSPAEAEAFEQELAALREMDRQVQKGAAFCVTSTNFN